MSRRPDQLAARYVAWVKRHALAIVFGHLLVLGGALYLITHHLPLYADFSYLLPQDAPAVVDLRKLEARVKAGDFVLAVIDAPTPEARAAAHQQLAEGIRALPKDLVERVEADDAELRAFFKAHRHLFVPLADLELARDTLQKQIDRAKLRANPAYIDLEEPDPAEEAKTQRQLDELQAKRREAEARLDRPTNVSADGKVSIIQIRTPFRTTDAGRGRQLLDALDELRAKAVAQHPGLKIGFTGSVVTAVAEHNAIFNGMVLSSIITTLLVGLVLVLYFRSATLLVLLLGTLGISTVISFGFAAVTVGHLNAATAFLGAIIAGNGVNYGILLIARYLEERRTREPEAALATAITGTLRPTAVASLGAAIAYGSLAATSFKGFADFAVIGAIGMLICWVATYFLLPALMLRFGRSTRVYSGDPIVGSTLVRMLGFRRSGVVCIVAAALTIVCTVIVVRYVAADPFEYDIKQLRSEGDDAVEARAWMALSDKHFGRGITSRTYIAAETPEQVPQIVAALRARDAGKPAPEQTIGTISSRLDVIPEQQPQRLAVLAKLRELIDTAAAELEDEKARADLLALRPPDDLRAITPERLPPLLRERLSEVDPTWDPLESTCRHASLSIL